LNRRIFTKTAAAFAFFGEGIMSLMPIVITRNHLQMVLEKVPEEKRSNVAGKIVHDCKFLWAEVIYAPPHVILRACLEVLLEPKER
jgi:hypothetical protein